MPIQKLKDIEIYYDEYGTGDRYLFSASQFHSKIDSFTIGLAKEGFHVFNVTIRGYGKSSHVFGEGFGEHWYDVWSQDICDLADALGIDKFFYTGISHGAGIGWYLCRYHPERVRGFFSIVGGPHTKDGVETSAARMATINACKDPELFKEYVAFRRRQAIEQFAARKDEPEYEALVEEQAKFWESMRPEEGLIDPLKPFPRAKTEEALVEELKNITTPTIHIGGMLDAIIFPENLVRSCKAVKNSKMVIYSDCTHGVARERMGEVVHDILQFCADRQLY